MNTSFCLTVLFGFLACCGQTASDNNKANSSSVANVSLDTCDSPDAHISCCFINMPREVNSVMSIVGEDEPGARLSLSGTVFKADGNTPYPNVVLYAYHTDAKGYYSKKGNEIGSQKWHGYLHGWCKTDDRGKYQINTIRPAPYPDNSMPAHIHVAIKKPQSKDSYYISDFVFADDALVTDRYLRSIEKMIGGSGVVHLTKSPKGVWTGERDITLK